MNTPIIISGETALPAPMAHPAADRHVPDRVALSAVATFLRRRLRILIGCLALCLILGVGFTMLQTPTYISTAQITLAPRVQQIAPMSDQDRAAQQNSISDMYVDTQSDVIMSAENVGAVVDRLGLAKDPRFTAGNSAQAARDLAIKYIHANTTVFRSGATYSIGITVQSSSALQAAAIANALAEQYTSGSLDDKDRDDQSSLKAIGQRMEAARLQSVADATVLQRYRLAHNLPSTTDKSLTEQEISSYNEEVTRAKAEAAEDAARLATARRQLGSGSSGDDVGEALGSPVISSLRQQQTTDTAEVAALSGKYGPQHPDLVRAQRQLAAVNVQIKDEIGRVISNLSAKSNVSQQRLASLEGSLGSSQGALRQQNLAMVDLQALQQKADASQGLYESYLTRYKEMSARMGIRQPEATILQKGEVARFPARPNVLINMALATALGLGLGLAVAIVVDQMAHGIASGEELETRLGVRYLCSVPELSSVAARKLRKAPEDSVIEDPRTAFAESFRNLRASIAFAVKHPKIIAITSALPGEGKTTLSLCLGRSMAVNSDAILLIDCDMRRRGASKWLGEERSVGLLEVLRGEVPLERALLTDQVSGLKVLPMSDTTGEDHELLTGERMDALLARVSSLYDAVILDTAPVLAIADARLLLRKADASILAVRWRKTPEAALRSALRMLPGEHVRLAGVVLSRMDMRKQSRFSQGQDAFYKSYKSYYA